MTELKDVIQNVQAREKLNSDLHCRISHTTGSFCLKTLVNLKSKERETQGFSDFAVCADPS